LQIGCTVYKKLPLRCYIGIRTRRQSKTLFQNISYYDFSKQEFVTKLWIEFHDQLSKIEEYFVQKKMFADQEWSFLIEWQKYASLWTLKRILVLIAYWESLQSYPHDSALRDLSSERINEHPHYKAIMKNFDALLRRVRLTDYPLAYIDCFSHLHNWHYPSVVFGTPTPYITRLNDLFPYLPTRPTLIFDTTLIYTWIPAFSSMQQTSINNTPPEVDILLHTMYHQKLPVFQPKFYALTRAKDSYFEYLKGIASHLILHDIDILQAIYNPSTRELRQNEYTDILRKKQFLHRIMYDLSEDVTTLVSHINSHFLHHQKSIAWYRLNPKNNWGMIAIVTPIERFRKTLQKDLKKMLMKKYPNSLVYYESREDWTAGSGIRLEQHVPNGMFSEFVSSGYVTVTWATKNITHPTRFQWENHPIVLDMIQSKVLYHGKKLPSSLLPTQKYTVEVIRLLLKHQWEKVYNTQFPVSTYSKHKNDMMAKVVLPRKKFIKQFFGIPFPLHCEWKWKDFWLTMDKDPIGIVVVDEV